MQLCSPVLIATGLVYGNHPVHLSVMLVHWRIIANLGFKFRSKFTAHCARLPQCTRIHFVMIFAVFDVWLSTQWINYSFYHLCLCICRKLFHYCIDARVTFLVFFLKENPQFDANRCHPFCCDVTSDCLTNYLAEASADLATVIFCLSAIHPNKMVAVLENIYSVSEILFSFAHCKMFSIYIIKSYSVAVCSLQCTN